MPPAFLHFLHILWLPAASFFAGVLGSLISIGGGIIITPQLVLGFGIDMRYALAPHGIR